MQRPENIPRIVWFAITLLSYVMMVYYFMWERFTKAGRLQRKAIEELHAKAARGELHWQTYTNARPIELPPDYGTWLLMNDEPTKGRELRRQEAEEAAKRQQ